MRNTVIRCCLIFFFGNEEEIRLHLQLDGLKEIIVPWLTFKARPDVLRCLRQNLQVKLLNLRASDCLIKRKNI